MVDIDNLDAAGPNGDRNTTSAQTTDEKKDVRLDTRQVVVLLFTAALLPSYLVPKQLTFDSE